MKCKKGYKKSGNKCVEEKTKKIGNVLKSRWFATSLFIIFSFVLFVNNITDLFVKYGLYISIQWVSYIGLIFAVFYGTWTNLVDSK